MKRKRTNLKKYFEGLVIIVQPGKESTGKFDIDQHSNAKLLFGNEIKLK